MLPNQEQQVENFQNQHWEDIDYNEEERELEEALSFSDLPISSITIRNEDDGAKEEEDQNEANNLDFDFDFGSLIGSISAFDGEMCAADEVFSGGQILPYRNSVSSMSGLRSVSRSESMDHRMFGSRSSSIRSSSIRSHYSATSSSGSSSCSNNTTFSVKTVPLVSKSKVQLQNKFHSHPSPKPQILGSGPRLSSYASPIGKRSKMWEVLKLGLVRTPEIELQDLKLRNRTSNFGKTMSITRNNSISNSYTKVDNNNIDRPRKSCSIDGNRISDFALEMQKRKNQLSNIKSNNSNGFFKSCKCSIGAIEPLPISLTNYGTKSGNFGSNKFGNRQNISSPNQVSYEDKKLAQKKLQLPEEQQQNQQQQRRNKQIRQRKQGMSHHHRTFEWLKNLSHASVLNTHNS